MIEVIIALATLGVAFAVAAFNVLRQKKPQQKPVSKKVPQVVHQSNEELLR
jgi:hypothetical protein